jgi:hypothetical protein
MAQPLATLLLDQGIWDICLDASNNLALAQPPYAVAQDVGSAVKTFIGEVWYDTTLGLPYFQQILGHKPPLALVTVDVEEAALTVPGVVVATATLAIDPDVGTITGNVVVVDENGVTQTTSF